MEGKLRKKYKSLFTSGKQNLKKKLKNKIIAETD